MGRKGRGWGLGDGDWEHWEAEGSYWRDWETGSKGWWGYWEDWEDWDPGTGIWVVPSPPPST